MISVEDLALVTLASVFSVCGLFYAGIFGVSLARLYPKALTSKVHKKLENPAWETGSLLLLAGLGGFVYIFNNAIEPLSREIDYLITLALLAAIVRLWLLLWIGKQRESKRITLAYKLSFAISAAIASLSICAVGVYMLYGKQFWQVGSAAVLMLGCALGIVAVALSVVRFKKDPLRLSGLLWLVVIGCLWPLSLAMTGSELLGYWYILWLSFMIVAISITVITDGLAKRNYLRITLPALALISVPLLAMANRPYLVASNITVHEAYKANNSVPVIIICILGWALVLVSLWVFLKIVSPKLRLNLK